MKDLGSPAGQTDDLATGDETTRLSVSTSAFDDWVNGRNPTHYSTNHRSQPIAFQQWRPVKEAFTPEFVRDAFTRCLRPVDVVLDPFAGSGTTPLSTQFLGAYPVSFEVNPFLAALTNAKLESYAGKDLESTLAWILRHAPLNGSDPKEVFEGAPATLLRPGLHGKYLFHDPAARALAGLRRTIDAVEDLQCRRLFTVLLASISVSVSNATVSGKGRRYRKNWGNRTISASQVIDAFARRAKQAIFDVRRFTPRPTQDHTTIAGDVRNLVHDVPQFDLAVFSPPYPNSFDYTDVYNIELWIGGYLRSRNENARLRQATFTSHVQLLRHYPDPPAGSRRLDSTLADLDAVRHTLWNPYIPDMVGGYFSELQTLLYNLLLRLRDGGSIFLTIGDSQYAGIPIRTARILSEFASGLNLRVTEPYPARTLPSSAQQKPTAELQERTLHLQAT